jgi:hypothetical protein
MGADEFPEVVLSGGPYDGKTHAVGVGVRAPIRGVYGWKYECGHETFAIGWYDADGAWEHPKRGVVEDGVCADCWEGDR